MVAVSICVGSSCHLKGSYDVIEAFRKEIKDRGLEGRIDLKAAFCLGNCGHDGVSIKIDNEVITGVTPEKVKDLFDEKVRRLL